jgi:hypothetical protein
MKGLLSLSACGPMGPSCVDGGVSALMAVRRVPWRIHFVQDLWPQAMRRAAGAVGRFFAAS